MAFAVTTTHAVPQKLLPARVRTLDVKLTVCFHCFQVLGAAHTKAESALLESKHICKEKLDAQRPAVALPFN
ncbi:MAG TPA: hypothetical protein VHB45_04245 [Alloacidobacterium sp.]|nr:hypothetical protein [Alloacidobacterium sp.]